MQNHVVTASFVKVTGILHNLFFWCLDDIAVVIVAQCQQQGLGFPYLGTQDEIMVLVKLVGTSVIKTCWTQQLPVKRL